MFGGESAFTSTMDVGDLRARNGEALGGLYVEVGRNTREGALGSHRFAVIAVEHGTPRIGVTVARRGTEYGETNIGGVGNETHKTLTRW